VGNTNQESHIDLNNDSRVFEYGLRIVRNAGIGSQSSSIIHRGTEPLFINANDNADLRLLTNNTERIRVGSSGTITVYQNNSETDTRGGHLRLTQDGPGDVVLSWDITNANANQRWYSGIDVSDGFSWKLANPSTILAYGNENFDTDTKIKVDASGNLTLNSSSGITTFSGSSIVSNVSGSFDLLNTNISSVNAFGRAETINLARNTNNSRVYIRGTTQSTTTSNGALVVAGGVGIDKNLHVGETVQGTRLISTVATGTAPISVNSTTKVTNLNADLLDGLDLHTGTNNEANKIVRTEGNGYLFTGYINSLVPYNENTNSSPDRVWGSNAGGDSYLRTYRTSALNVNFANSSSVVNGQVNLGSGNDITGSYGAWTGEKAGKIQFHSNNLYLQFTSNLIGRNSGGGQPMVLDSTGNVSFTGDVTAFASDIRLKTNIEPIENALNKVMKLSGFTYNFNDTAKELGFNPDTRYVGVSTQEVQSVLSEAVKPAPADSKYITVQYEKLVPLLIEAIKEQQSTILTLNERINNLEKLL